MRTVEDVAREVDVMGGIAHISSLTDQAAARRRAADLIREQQRVIHALHDRIAEMKATADRKIGGEMAKLNACGPKGNRAYFDRCTFYEGQADALSDVLALFTVSPSGE